MSLAIHSPEATKLPDISSSPGPLTISSASPVSRASLMAASPLTISASAGIWFPALSTITSPSTSLSIGTLVRLPSRITTALGSCRMLSPSSTFLACSSWKIPISVFAMITGRNVRLLKAPATINRRLMIRKIRLKYVSTFSFIMSLVVFAVRSICTLTLPFAVSSLT